MDSQPRDALGPLPYDPQDRLNVLATAASLVSQQSAEPETAERRPSDDSSNWYTDYASNITRGEPARRPKVSALQDEHVIITAVLYSWNEAQKSGCVDPQWQLFHRFDEGALGNKNAVVRAAVAWFMRSNWKYRCHPDPDSVEAKSILPAWLLPRPAQAPGHSPTIVDTLVWYLPRSCHPSSHLSPSILTASRPGLKDRACLSPSRYLTNGCLRETAVHFQFNWQAPFEDAYEVSPVTNMLQFTPAFRRSLLEINNWTLEMAWFEDYPETRSDIPVWETTVLKQVQHAQTQRAAWLVERVAQQRSETRGTALGPTIPDSIQRSSYLQRFSELQEWLRQHHGDTTQSRRPWDL